MGTVLSCLFIVGVIVIGGYVAYAILHDAWRSDRYVGELYQDRETGEYYVKKPRPRHPPPPT